MKSRVGRDKRSFAVLSALVLVLCLAGCAAGRYPAAEADRAAGDCDAEGVDDLADLDLFLLNECLEGRFQFRRSERIDVAQPLAKSLQQPAGLGRFADRR